MQGIARGGEHGVRNLERLSGVEPFECAISASPATESRKNRRIGNDSRAWNWLPSQELHLSPQRTDV